MRSNSKHIAKFPITIFSNANYGFENYVLIVSTVKEWKNEFVNCLPIAFNSEVISFPLNFLILLDVLKCSHLIILSSRRY